jgi:hypothetical protein
MFVIGSRTRSPSDSEGRHRRSETFRGLVEGPRGFERDRDRAAWSLRRRADPIPPCLGGKIPARSPHSRQSGRAREPRSLDRDQRARAPARGRDRRASRNQRRTEHAGLVSPHCDRPLPRRTVRGVTTRASNGAEGAHRPGASCTSLDTSVHIEPFAILPRLTRASIAAEAERLATFLGGDLIHAHFMASLSTRCRGSPRRRGCRDRVARPSPSYEPLTSLHVAPPSVVFHR